MTTYFWKIKIASMLQKEKKMRGRLPYHIASTCYVIKTASFQNTEGHNLAKEQKSILEQTKYYAEVWLRICWLCTSRDAKTLMKNLTPWTKIIQMSQRLKYEKQNLKSQTVWIKTGQKTWADISQKRKY